VKPVIIENEEEAIITPEEIEVETEDKETVEEKKEEEKVEVKEEQKDDDIIVSTKEELHGESTAATEVTKEAEPEEDVSKYCLLNRLFSFLQT